MRDVYHCTPEELDNQDARLVELHLAFMVAQGKEEFLKQKRAEQQSGNAKR